MWVVIVSLIVSIMFILFLGILHVEKQIKAANALLIRAEERERQSKLRAEPAKSNATDLQDER